MPRIFYITVTRVTDEKFSMILVIFVDFFYIYVVL